MTNANTTTTQPTDQTIERRVWLLRNPGICQQIASDAGVSLVYVHDVLRGLRPGRSGKGANIREALKAAGAPGFEQYTQSPAEGA